MELLVQTPPPAETPASPVGPRVQCATSFNFANCLVEQVYDRSNRRSELEVMHSNGTTVRVPVFPVPNLHLEIRPVENDLVHRGRVILPEKREPYGSTGALVEAIRQHVERYVVLPEEMRDVAVHYVLLTWVYDRFETVPYLRFIGDLGVGKSRALRVIGQLCYHPFMAAGSASMSAIFRSLDMLGRATLVMDEVDFFLRSDTHQEMMTMLRQGFQKGCGVLRAEAARDTFEPRDYEVFGPKALAGRKSFPDPALESRCLRVYMQAGVPLGNIPSELPASYIEEVLLLQNQLLQWRFDHNFAALQTPEPLDVEPRLLQLFNPLASVVSDTEALGRLRRAMLELQEDMTEMRSTSLEGRILAALLAAYDTDGRRPGALRVQLKPLAGSLGDEWHKGPTPKTVAGICRGFGMAMGKNKHGAYVEFDPTNHSAILARYGLAEAAEPETLEPAA